MTRNILRLRPKLCATLSFSLKEVDSISSQNMLDPQINLRSSENSTFSLLFDTSEKIDFVE